MRLGVTLWHRLMHVIAVCGIVFAAGCFGGLVNALLVGELHLPRLDRRARVRRPGWFGNVVVGGAAALVFWGLYGPMAGAQIIGDGPPAHMALHVAELFGAMLSGIGGGRLLSSEVDRRVLRNENDALNQTKSILADVVATMSSKQHVEKEQGNE